MDAKFKTKWTEDDLERARAQGREAFKRGWTRHNCPWHDRYERPMSQAWESGFTAA